MNSMDRFLNNSKNAHFIGNDNIYIKGNKNIINKIVHNHHKAKKEPIKITPDPLVHISTKQANEIKSMLKNIVEKEVIGGMDTPLAFQKWHNQLKLYMNVQSHLLIKKEFFEIAVEYLRKQNTLKRSKTRRADNDYWRNDIYKAIYTRTTELNISKIKLYDITYKKFNKKITSLKDLGEQNLDKLRIYIYSIKGK